MSSTTTNNTVTTTPNNVSTPPAQQPGSNANIPQQTLPQQQQQQSTLDFGFVNKFTGFKLEEVVGRVSNTEDQKVLVETFSLVNDTYRRIAVTREENLTKNLEVIKNGYVAMGKEFNPKLESELRDTFNNVKTQSVFHEVAQLCTSVNQLQERVKHFETQPPPPQQQQQQQQQLPLQTTQNQQSFVSAQNGGIGQSKSAYVPQITDEDLNWLNATAVGIRMGGIPIKKN